MAERSVISIISILLNLFLAFKRIYTENIFAAAIYINPIIEPYKPASLTDLGTEINEMPTYILIKFAAVKNQVDVLILESIGFTWRLENKESV